MVLSNYAYEVEVAASNVFANDAKLKANGTLGVKVREREQQQPDDGCPELIQAFMPYVGVRVTNVTSEIIGNGLYSVVHTLRTRCVCEKANAIDAVEQAQNMADAVVGCLLAYNGSASFVSSGKQVLIESSSIGQARTGVFENPYCAECLATVSVAVIST